jgi:uncharacterized protein with von Willebrand factor type A (vWA) domain
MKEVQAKPLLLDLFHRLRRAGADLGIGELLAAYRAVDERWGGGDSEALRQLGRLLWCKSLQEAADFEEIFDVAMAARALLRAETPLPEVDKEPVASPPTPEQTPTEPPPSAPPTEPPRNGTELTALPLRTPPQPQLPEAGEELRAYWPVSRRSMIYTWRYLRRPVKDGPRNVLNLAATVEQTARRGLFLEPVYERLETNRAHLVLLLDQGGSMVPFHRFTRDLSETACEEGPIGQVDVAYFRNVPTGSLYRDPHLTEPLALDDALAGCSPDSSILLVGDAGAARGYRNLQRVRASTKLLVDLKRMTTLIAWLNPMPRHRWSGTSAELIAHLVPMFQMDPDGFSNAVDVLRGQPLHSHR